MRRPLLILIPLAALSISACDDERRTAGMPTAPSGIEANELSAFLTISKPHAGIGERITVTVRSMRGANVGEIGSFTLKLAYDSTQLELVEAKQAARGMVMTNGAKRGLLVAAGASGEGFDDDRLMTATFLVTGARPMRGLWLDVTELNSIKFEDQRSAMRVEKQVFLSEQQ